MKKMLIVVGLILVMTSASFAALSVGVLGAYYSFKEGSFAGGGLELGIGIIPFVDTRLVAIYSPGPTPDESFIPATLNLKFGMPGMPVYLDGGVGYVFYNNKSSGVTSSTGAMTYNVALGYEHEIFTFTKLFIQGGYEGLTVKYEYYGSKEEKNFSGWGAKYGVRFSI